MLIDVGNAHPPDFMCFCPAKNALMEPTTFRNERHGPNALIAQILHRIFSAPTPRSPTADARRFGIATTSRLRSPRADSVRRGSPLLRTLPPDIAQATGVPRPFEVSCRVEVPACRPLQHRCGDN